MFIEELVVNFLLTGSSITLNFIEQYYKFKGAWTKGQWTSDGGERYSYIKRLLPAIIGWSVMEICMDRD